MECEEVTDIPLTDLKNGRNGRKVEENGAKAEQVVWASCHMPHVFKPGVFCMFYETSSCRMSPCHPLLC